jgi:hypothetical protein
MMAKIQWGYPSQKMRIVTPTVQAVMILTKKVYSLNVPCVMKLEVGYIIYLHILTVYHVIGLMMVLS